MCNLERWENGCGCGVECMPIAKRMGGEVGGRGLDVLFDGMGGVEEECMEEGKAKPGCCQPWN